MRCGTDKVDFAIAGNKHSRMQVKLEVEEREVDWLDPEWGSVSHLPALVSDWL
jgi:hypothetical protein